MPHMVSFPVDQSSWEQEGKFLCAGNVYFWFQLPAEAAVLHKGRLNTGDFGCLSTQFCAHLGMSSCCDISNKKSRQMMLMLFRVRLNLSHCTFLSGWQRSRSAFLNFIQLTFISNGPLSNSFFICCESTWVHLGTNPLFLELLYLPAD